MNCQHEQAVHCLANDVIWDTNGSMSWETAVFFPLYIFVIVFSIIVLDFFNFSHILSHMPLKKNPLCGNWRRCSEIHFNTVNTLS